MDDMTAFERQVAGEFVRRAGPVRPVNAAAIFTASTATQSPKWRFGSMFSATKFAVAGAIVALFGGFLLAGVLTQPSDERLLPAASASRSSSPEATADASPDPELAPDAPVSDLRLAGDGPWLSFEPDSEDQDVLREAERDGLMPRRDTADDGTSTGLSEPWPERWWDEGFGFRAALDGGNDDWLYVAVERPGGEIVRRRIGRKDDPSGPLSSYGGSGGGFAIAGTGILMRAEQDQPGREETTPRTWYSPDGEEWTERRSVWQRGDDMIGTTRGFIRIREDRLHRSTDGTDWVQVPGTYPSATYLGERDRDQVLAYLSDDGLRVGRLTDAGIEVYPYSTEAFGSERPDRGTRGDAVVADLGLATDDPWVIGVPNLLGLGERIERRFSGVGGLGIVHLDGGNRTIVFTPDGTRWSAIAMPEDWVPLRPPPPPGAFAGGGGVPSIWVTDDSVLLAVTVMAPGVGDEERTERTFRGTMVEAVAASASAPAEPTTEAPFDEPLDASDLLPGVDLETSEVTPGITKVVSDGHRPLGQLLDVEVTADGSIWVLRTGDVIRLGMEQPSHQVGPGELATTPAGKLIVRDWFGSPEYSVWVDGSWVPPTDETDIPCEDESQGDCYRVASLVSIAEDGSISIEGWPGAIRLPGELQPTESAIDAEGRAWVVASGPSSPTARFPQPDGGGIEHELAAGELYVITPEAVAATE